jgi:peroxiredoxin
VTSTQPKESLKAQFDALHAERERTWEPAQLARNIETRQRLVDAFDPSAVVRPGDRVAPFGLEDSQGGEIALADLLSGGPAVLVFFRFAGCPACNLALPYYDRQLRPALDALGATLVAVSPHLPEKGLDAIRERHQLGFRVAADRDNRLARRFGISFDRGVVPAGQPTPGWIGELTGTGTAELPQPAVIVIDRDATIRFADISPDWLDRTEAPDILAQFADARNRAAA